MDLQDNQPANREPNNGQRVIILQSSSKSLAHLSQPLPDELQEEGPIPLLHIHPHNQNNPIIAHQVPIFSIRSEPLMGQREEKLKKKKVRHYISDFTQYLPPSLIAVTKTPIPAKIRIGERYQANVPKHPELRSQYRPMQQWLIWDGSTHPEQQPSEEHLLKFKELLGENRTEQQLIQMRERQGRSNWRQVLDYVGKNKTELRRIFHIAQRNRV